MNGSSTDKGKIVYVKPADTTVECTAKNNVVSVTEENGEWTITPLKGGFDVVTFKVTGGDTNKTYTINVYVNRAVTSDNFSVTLKEGEKPIEERENVYGTTATTVSFEVTVNCQEGAMAGKRIYVEYGSTKLTAKAGEVTFTGEIDFTDLSTLQITVGVEYDAASTAAYKPEESGDVAVSSTGRTLARNAESITVTYGGVQTTKIVTKDNTITFGEEVGKKAKIKIEPTAHTDTLAYDYSGDTATATFEDGTLTFTKAGTVTLTVKTVRGGEATVTKEITVIYEPLGEGNTEITLKADTQNIVMSPDAQARIYFTEKENTTVNYSAADGGGVIEADGNSGVYHITAKKGGFATVTVNVSGAEQKTYTVNIYVNAPVKSGDISVKFENTTFAEGVYGTTATTVSFEVTVNCQEGAMAGKRIYVEYGKTRVEPSATQGENTYKGTIDFPETARENLTVTVGVEYAESAGEYSLSGEIPGVVNSYELARNAKSITVTYGGVVTTKIVTSSATIDFNGKVTVAPEAHTDKTLAYVLEGGAGIAELDGGKLTFTGNGTVTVIIKTMRGNTETGCKTTITVTYEPLGEGNTEITLKADTQNIVMTPNTQARIYFTEPANTTVTYAVTKGNGDVITTDKTSGVYHITAKKGGFATVTVTVSGAAGSAVQKTYTVNIYVNASVAKENISVQFENATLAGDVYGTTATTVSFTVTVTCKNDAMQGKQIFVEYGSTKLTANPGKATFSGEIDFKDLGELQVTVGVEYAEEANAYALKGEIANTATTRTLGRNAESITVTYGGVETVKIVTSSNTINFGESRDKDAVVAVAPANHTDTLSYALEEGGNGIARIEGSKLTFTGNGTVTVILKTVRGNEDIVTTKITVTYEALGDNVEIKLDKNEQSIVLPLTTENQKQALIYYTVPEGAEADFTFTMRSRDSDVITTEFKNGADETSGVYHIVPKTGGFATVTITVEGGSVPATYTIKIYVDAPVTEADFTVEFKAGSAIDSQPPFVVYAVGQEYITSETFLSYKVTVANNNGAMLGKQLCIEYTGQAKPEIAAERTLTKFPFAVINFGENTTLTFTFSVQYTKDAVAYGATGQDSLARTSRTAITTKGGLSKAPTVTYDRGAKTLSTDENSENNKLFFANIGDEITFTVDDSNLIPVDYKLNAGSYEFNGYGIVEFNTVDGKTFTLTALKNTTEKELTLFIGKKEFKLTITVQSRVQEIQVTCGETVIGDGQNYKTLVDSLTFTVKAGRLDGEPVTNSELEYNDGSSWKSFDVANRSGDSVNGYEYTYTLSGLVGVGSKKQVDFRATDGSGRTFTLLIERAQLKDFSLEVGVSFSDGKPPVVIGRTKSVADVRNGLEYVLPARMSGTLTLYILADDIYLGGFGSDEQFASIVPVQKSSDSQNWEIEHTLISMGTDILPHADINLTVPSDMKGSASLEIGGGASGAPQCTIKFTVSSADIAWIEFPGFDGNNSADVYKGYQQVRVFAKKSDYGDGKLVDYYRIPVAAYAEVKDMQVNKETGKRNPMTDLSGLTWKLTSYTDSTYTDDVVVTQTGRQVIYNDTTYNIVGEAGAVTLQLQPQEGAATTIVNADGTYAAEQPHVPWVDTVSEAAEGYVRVYFGEFVGLSETDVQNDYFGNFGEEEDWARPTEAEMYGVEGKKLEPSKEGAFSFLRLEGGDGVANAHFNFNVLQDTNLVNVFNATGYYAHDSLVLHENLYGPGELAGNEALDREAQDNDLYLKETAKTKVGKTASSKIYGNGYQLNFQARNDICTLTSGKENTGDGTEFGTFYNVTVKGCNPVTNILPNVVRMIYTLGGAYYSDIQYYSKMNPKSGKLCLKNTVLHCVANAAIQLWWGNMSESTQNVYFEDVVLAECLRGLSLEGNVAEQVGSLHIKGGFDVLNYTNAKGMQDRFNAINGGDFYSHYFTEEGIAAEKTPGLIDLAPDYLEWFGSNGTTEKINHRYYINMILTSSSMNTKATVKIEAWDDKTNQYSGDAKLVEKYNLKSMEFSAGGAGVAAYTYDVENTIDGGNSGFRKRDMSKLFTEKRDIRLLCEYKTMIDTTLVKNDDHIKWHMNQVYRDVELAGQKEGHIANLKKTLVGVKWPDGTSAANAGVTAAIALNELLSETVIPSKSAY